MYHKNRNRQQVILPKNRLKHDKPLINTTQNSKGREKRPHYGIFLHPINRKAHEPNQKECESIEKIDEIHL